VRAKDTGSGGGGGDSSTSILVHSDAVQTPGGNLRATDDGQQTDGDPMAEHPEERDHQNEPFCTRLSVVLSNWIFNSLALGYVVALSKVSHLMALSH
jgi:hypothetical protein